MKEFFKKHIFDILVCLILVVSSCIPFISKCFVKDSDRLIATIQVQNEIVKVIDLSSVEKENSFTIKGAKGDVVIGLKPNSIAILESSCPGKICIHTGYVSEPGKPIVCAYNLVLITIDGAEQEDVDVEVI